MIRQVTQSFWSGLLLGSLSAMAGCAARVDPGDGSSPPPSEDAPDAVASGSGWFEGWEAAPLGPKAEHEWFEGDGGSWQVFDVFGQEIQDLGYGYRYGTDIAIIEGKQLLLHSVSVGGDTSGSLHIFIGDVTPGTIDLDWLNTVPLTENTTISGILDCDARVDGPEGDEGYAYIKTGYPGFVLVYLHEKSVGGPVDNDRFKTIFIPDHFERNIYGDLVMQFGQEFIDYYESNDLSNRVHSVFIEISTSGAAECTCYVDDLRIANHT